MKTKLRNQKGFTIIEVLIVLAIAGLILLIVFLAVPALQRNSRNTQRRGDVAKLLGLVTEHASSTNGLLPTTAVCFNEMILNRGTGSSSVSAPGAFYCRNGSGTNIIWDDSAASGSNPSTIDTVVLRSGAICDNAGNLVTAGASARNVAAVFRLEINTPQCQSE